MVSKGNLHFRFFTKVGIGGGVVYLTVDQGIWGSSHQATAAYDRLFDIMPGTKSVSEKVSYNPPSYVGFTLKWIPRLMTTIRMDTSQLESNPSFPVLELNPLQDLKAAARFNFSLTYWSVPPQMQNFTWCDSNGSSFKLYTYAFAE